MDVGTLTQKSVPTDPLSEGHTEALHYLRKWESRYQARGRFVDLSNPLIARVGEGKRTELTIDFSQRDFALTERPLRRAPDVLRYLEEGWEIQLVRDALEALATHRKRMKLKYRAPKTVSKVVSSRLNEAQLKALSRKLLPGESLGKALVRLAKLPHDNASP